MLERKLGIPIVSFSYPWNKCNNQTMKIVENAGYKHAVTHHKKRRTDFKANPLRLYRRAMDNSNSVKEFIA